LAKQREWSILAAIHVGFCQYSMRRVANSTQKLCHSNQQRKNGINPKNLKEN